jgi:predicted DsbA family dithiol-disulfide isomerase
MSELADGAVCGADGCSPTGVTLATEVSPLRPEAMLQVEVISDAICPWCYVAKRQLDRAVEVLRKDFVVTVRWKPFELNPDMPKEGRNRREYRSAKFGSWEYSQRLDAEVAEAGRQAGLEFHHERMERTPNTFDAHRLIWFAEKQGVQDAVIEGLFAGYFTNGRDVGDRPVLTDIAIQAGLNRATVEVFLAGHEGAEEVRQSERAAYESGVSGVPTVSVNRKLAFSGALKAEAMIAKIRAAAGAMPIAHGSSPPGTAPVRRAW